MDLLSPAQRQLSEALRAALAEHPEQEPGNWIVYNSGAEVASGLSLAEALEYLTPERLARQWCAVCVVDQSNLPKTPQPAKPAEQEPVAWMCSNTELMHKGYQMFSATSGGDWNIPVYTAPQPRRRLTANEVLNLMPESIPADHDGALMEFARAIEAAVWGEKT